MWYNIELACTFCIGMFLKLEINVEIGWRVWHQYIFAGELPLNLGHGWVKFYMSFQSKNIINNLYLSILVDLNDFDTHIYKYIYIHIHIYIYIYTYTHIYGTPFSNLLNGYPYKYVKIFQGYFAMGRHIITWNSPEALILSIRNQGNKIMCSFILHKA